MVLPVTATGAVTEAQLAELFTPGCDPYHAGAAVLLDKPPSAVSQDDRDLVKRVFTRIAARRGDMLESVPTLRRTADLFHEVGSAVAAEDLIADCRNAILADALRAKLRSRDQIKSLTAEGFELCVRALAALGATDVTIHECGDRDMEHW